MNDWAEIRRARRNRSEPFTLWLGGVFAGAIGAMIVLYLFMLVWEAF